MPRHGGVGCQSRAEALRAPHAAGITEPAIRSPFGHYHGVDRWFQPDLRNGCITGGCHDPIPHSKSKALRAFANLHATFMTCHRGHPPLLDFQAVGYPPERVKALTSMPIVEMMHQIRQGQPFNLPLTP